MEDFEHLDARIEHLAIGAASHLLGKRDWKSLWATIKSIGADFKNTRYPNREQRHAAWNRFQSIVQKIKLDQDKEFGDRNSRRENSSRHLAKINTLAENAEPDSALGQALAEGIAAIASHGLTLIVKAGLNALPGEFEEQQHRLRKRSEAMKVAWTYLSEHKEEMLGKDKAQAFATLKATKDRLDADWQEWKRGKNELFEERRKEREERHDAWVAKQAAWRSKQEEFIERLETAEAKLEGALSKQEQHLVDLYEKRRDAWSDSFRDRVEGWIDEARDQISQIEGKLSDVRAKLRDARDRLNS